MTALSVTTMGIKTPRHIIGRTVALEIWEPTKILVLKGESKFMIAYDLTGHVQLTTAPVMYAVIKEVKKLIININALNQSQPV